MMQEGVECQAQVCHMCMPKLVAQQKQKLEHEEATRTVDHVIANPRNVTDQASSRTEHKCVSSNQYTHEGNDKHTYSSEVNSCLLQSACGEKKIKGTFEEKGNKEQNTKVCPNDIETLYSDNTHAGSAGEMNMADILCEHTRVAILFSGGIDSLVIAALANRCVLVHTILFALFTVYKSLIKL